MEAGSTDHKYSGKKVKETTREITAATFMLRCAQLGLSLADLDQMSMGMVTDMLIEKSNDQHEYPVLATQDDFDAF